MENLETPTPLKQQTPHNCDGGEKRKRVRSAVQLATAVTERDRSWERDHKIVCSPPCVAALNSPSARCTAARSHLCAAPFCDVRLPISYVSSDFSMPKNEIKIGRMSVFQWGSGSCIWSERRSEWAWEKQWQNELEKHKATPTPMTMPPLYCVQNCLE